MKHNPQATANALAVVGGVLYVLCAIWVSVSRSSYMGMMGSWAHGVDFSALPAATPGMGTLVVGLVTFIALAWFTGYAFAVTYNSFARK